MDSGSKAVLRSTQHSALSIQPMTLGGEALLDVRLDAHVATVTGNTRDYRVSAAEC